ncbi:MAG TPA: hypothetical protein VE987_15290, partial [Polyangiaceae bacterium]|nr:hypothetical protein [Polyangiaceae bacterium]
PSFNHPGQLRAMFPDVPFDGLVMLDHLPQVDHTQLLEEDRREVVEAIARRLVAYGPAQPDARESEVRLRGTRGDAHPRRRMAS